MTDSDLLHRYAETNSNEAFGELVSRHIALVHAAVMRRTNGDATLTAEITQGVFTLLARNAHRLQHHRALPGWLYVAARHATGNALRSERRRIAREQEALAMHETSSDAAESDWVKIRPEIDTLIDGLPERDRTALILRFFGGHKLGEVADVLQVTPDAARMRVDRALAKLRAALEKRGITSTTAALAGTLNAHATTMAVPSSLAGSVTLAACSAASQALGTGTLGLFTFMTAKMTTITFGGLALVAGGFAYRHHVQNERLSREVAALRKENVSREQAFQGQVTVLQRIVSEFDALKSKAALVAATSAKPEPRPSSPPTRGIAIKAWSNAGRSTPGAAFETALFAIASGDFQLATPAICFVGTDASAIRTIFEGLSGDARKLYGTPEFMYVTMATLNRDQEMRLGGLEIVDEVPDGVDHTLVHYRWDNDQRPRTMPMRRVDGQWVLELTAQGLEDPQR